MHEIFVSYRTSGGKAVAYMCADELSSRFGTDSVFLARKSLSPGGKWATELIQAVRRCRVMLVLIDEQWLDAPDQHRPGGRALDNPQDWVRREVEEALDAGVLVIPLLIGRKVEQLDPHRLPKAIAELAECQYARVELHSRTADLSELGDRLIRQVPGLGTLERRTEPTSDAGLTPEATVRNDRQSGGIGQVAGSVDTFVNEAHGPLNTGRGDQHNPHIVGDGTNYVTGENRGGTHQQFGPRPRRRSDER